MRYPTPVMTLNDSQLKLYLKATEEDELFRTLLKCIGDGIIIKKIRIRSSLLKRSIPNGFVLQFWGIPVDVLEDPHVDV